MSIEQTEWEYEWFYIIKVPDNQARGGKKLFTIRDKGFKMGNKHRIKWSEELKVYAFSPGPKISWNIKALQDIISFLEIVNVSEAEGGKA